MRPKGKRDLAAFSAREEKRVATEKREKRKRRVFLWRRTMGVKVGGKVIPASFLKVKERGSLVGAKDRGERDG